MKKKVVLSVAVVLLVVMVAVMCVACTPNADSLQKKLEKKDYKVVVQDGVGDTTKSLQAAKGTDELLMVSWFKDSETCKKYYDEAKANDSTFKLIFGDKEYKIVKKGNAVAVGTKNAIKLV